MENISILCYTISNINTGRRHIMNSTPETTQLFECIKQLSDSAVEKLLKMALDALELESTDPEVCPYCGGSHFVRYGKKQGNSVFSARTVRELLLLRHIRSCRCHTSPFLYGKRSLLAP